MSTHTATSAGTTTHEVTWAPVARVNLLPPEIDEGRKLRRLQRLLGGTVVLMILLMGGLYWQATRSVSSAQGDLDSSQSQNSALQSQQQLYQEVPKVTEQLQAAEAARASVLSGDVVWNRLTDDVHRAAPAGVTVGGIEIAPAVSTGTAAATGTTTGTGTTGTGTTGTGTATTAASAGLAGVTLTGTTQSLAQVGTWISALGKITGLSGVTLMSASGGGTGTGAAAAPVTYSISATVTSDALSQRYLATTEASK